MNKIKLSGWFLTTLIFSTSSIADTITFKKEYGRFHCTATILSTNDRPTVKIDTENRLVRGFCEDGNNIGGGTPVGTVPQRGHLANFPVSWTEANGTVRTLNDLCFDTKADKYFLGRPSPGSVSVEPQTGATSIHCEEGCANTKADFGTGNYC